MSKISDTKTELAMRLIPEFQAFATLVRRIERFGNLEYAYKQLTRLQKDQLPFFKLGAGAYRTVWVHRDYPGFVFKHCYNNDNMTELQVYNATPENMKKYLCKIYAISSDGSVLVSQRFFGKTIEQHDIEANTKNTEVAYVWQELNTVVENFTEAMLPQHEVCDMHDGNVMYNEKTKQYKIVDLGNCYPLG